MAFQQLQGVTQLFRGKGGVRKCASCLLAGPFPAAFQSILLSKPLFFQTRSGSRGDGFPVPSWPLCGTGADHEHTALSPVLNRCCIPRIPPLCLLSSTGQPGLSLAVPFPFLPVLGWFSVTKASTVRVHEARAYTLTRSPHGHMCTRTHTQESMQLTAQHAAMSQDLFGHSNGNNSSGTSQVGCPRPSLYSRSSSWGASRILQR